MESNKYTHTTQELIELCFKGCKIKAVTEDCFYFSCGEYTFYVTDSRGELIGVRKDQRWMVTISVPAPIERAHITNSRTFPEGYIKEFLEMRKDWDGNIKIEMKLTPVSG